METKNYKVTEILHHLGEEDLPFGAVNPPIFQTSIFSFKTFADFKRLCKMRQVIIFTVEETILLLT